MIPLKTLPDAARAPLWTRAFAVLVAFVWLVQLGVLAFKNVDLAREFGVRPACFFSPSSCGVAALTLPQGEVTLWLGWIESPFGRLLLSPFVSIWLHADWWHVGFNLLFLLVFGGAVEGEFGRFRFVRLYLGGALVATLCHVAFSLGSVVATIGASGAIAAILGAHFWRFPRAWVLTYFPPVFVLPVPAPLWGALWLGAQIVGALSLWKLPFVISDQSTNVAWMAHVGGFAWGAGAAWRFGNRKARGKGANVGKSSQRGNRKPERGKRGTL